MESSFGMGLPFLSSAVVIPLVIWSAIWKGIALWKAARRDQLGWYLALVAPRHLKLGSPTAVASPAEV